MRDLESAALAVSVADLFASVHFDSADDEDNVEACLRDAQSVVERAARRPMVRRSVEFQCRNIGWRRWWVPVAPVVSLTSVAWQQEDGTWADLGLTGVRLEQAFDEPQVVVPATFFAGVPDGAAIKVAATVGHSDGDRPGQLSRAVKLMVKEWYDAGIAIERPEVPQLTFHIQRLIKQVRYMRPSEYAQC